MSAEGVGIDLDDDLHTDHDEDDDGVAGDRPLPLRLPATLLALEDVEFGDKGDGESGNYRVATCAVHRSGALLLEARDGYYLDDQLRPKTSCSSPRSHDHDGGSTMTAVVFDGGNNACGADDDNDDAGCWGGEGGDGGRYVDDEIPLLETTMDALQVPVSPQEEACDLGEEEDEFFDPYTPLDPNDPSSMPIKPFRKLARIAKKPKMRRRAVAAEIPSTSIVDSLRTVPAPATGLLFPEFTYALKQSQYDVSSFTQKESKKSGGKTNPRQTTTSVFTLAEAKAAATEEDEYDGMFDYDAGDGGYGPGFFDDEIEAALGNASNGMFTNNGVYEHDDDDLDFEDFAAAADVGWDSTRGYDENGVDMEFADLCQAWVNARIQAARAATVQTELAMRVSTWRNKMAPVLEEEDQRPEFDIHAYSERILNGLSAIGKSTPATPLQFKDVVSAAEAEHRYDVPRMFSSMLQLINNGNLGISKKQEDDFGITLLSAEGKHKRIAEYKAPSASMDTFISVEHYTQGDDVNDTIPQQQQQPRKKAMQQQRRGTLTKKKSKVHVDFTDDSEDSGDEDNFTAPTPTPPPNNKQKTQRSMRTRRRPLPASSP